MRKQRTIHRLHLQEQMRQVTSALDRTAELEDADLEAIVQCTQRNVVREAAIGKAPRIARQVFGILNLLFGRRS